MLLVTFRGEELRYVTGHALPASASTDDAFTKMEEHFLTPDYKDTYTTERNRLSFWKIWQKHPYKTIPENLDCLFQRARKL